MGHVVQANTHDFRRHTYTFYGHSVSKGIYAMIMSGPSLIGHTHLHPCLILLLPMLMELTETQCVVVREYICQTSTTWWAIMNKCNHFLVWSLIPTFTTRTTLTPKLATTNFVQSIIVQSIRLGEEGQRPFPPFPLTADSSILMSFIGKIHPHTPPPKQICRH